MARTHPSVRAALLAGALLCLTGAPARAQGNPHDAEQRRLARQVRRDAREARAFVPLARLYDRWENTSPGSTREALERLAEGRRLPAPLRAYAAALGAALRVREGALDDAASRFRELGYVTRWRVAGPFDNEGKAGFARAYPPEAGRNEPVDPEARWPGSVRPVGWRHYPDVGRWGYVNLGAVLRPNENACAYAETFVESDRARPITLWIGAGGAVRAWFNGEPVLEDGAYRAPDFDRSVALVHARRGANRVLLKVCNADDAWGFYLRLGDAEGAPAEGLRVDPDAAREAAAPPSSPPRLPDAPVAALAGLEAAVAAAPESAQAHEDLARFLTYTYADDPAERRAVELAERAAELEPTWERWLLAARLMNERAERMRAVAEAARLAPDEPEVVVMRAALVATGPDPDRALRMLAPLDPTTPAGLDAVAFRASIYADLGLERTAAAEIERGAARAPGSVRWIRARIGAAQRMDRTEAVMQRTAELLEARFDDTGARRRLVADALSRHDREAVLEHVAQARALSPDDAGTLSWASVLYEALGLDERALAARREIIDLAPEDASAHADYGRALLRQEQREAAAAAFRRALELRPQDEAVRALLEEIQPSQRTDERYATALEDVLSRRRESDGWSAAVLHDLTVNTVFENGLGSSFRQIVTQVHDDDGARQWRRYSIPYDPATQWVEVRRARVIRADGSVLEAVRHGTRALGDPRYRIYYSRRAHVVTFPELELGDTVALRYRVNDVAHRNVFDDYYGDFRLLQRPIPTARLEYVLITPTSREIYFNDPELPSLRHERRVEGDRRVDTFAASRVAPVRSEPRMPGPSEIVPYLHVSTYRTWEEVGRWWWGLVSDQLVADADLRRTVEELVDGVDDVRERVERIYAWVIRNTRYVGLEFGIHGFQPYRVPLVVQRGFGDCKDKASLLYVMLREAGIEARLVLVRTRRNGRIGASPASLSVFDHAIAYVPELDLYLDGTAENGGTNALPTGDQGVSVLVVGPDDAELRRTPVAAPDVAGHELTTVAELAADGSATAEVTHEVRGPGAAGYRTRYQAQSTRTERLQRSLRSRFPGIEVEEPTFEQLDALESPVRFRYEARIPQLAQREGAGLLVAPSRLGGLGRSLGLTARRRHPIDLGGTRTFRERRVLRPPPGASVEEVPDGGVAESPFGRCEVRYERTGRGVEIRTELVWRRDRVPLDDYPAFRRWIAEVDALLRQRVRIGGAR
ncbi:MAG TPA: DUF3857 domain-containing protein [Sandaracinaceae bacterium LLY-WYZ-13_1]|nr:DUF3857 domain-containing protein [Sandaracinaceae bacterium LLY-WYZ-13_1]